ncbi:MAG: MFS transporter [Candidatus Nanopelagicales bacterium]|nr:MFS transporter [Candidatus Nanopelagicales bacterium]
MSTATTNTTTELDPNRWRALLVIAIAQLMVVLDASIVNIALPSLQADLGISDANRQWVVTGYTLAFGGLLLLGGRIADFWGRKRAFMTGLLGFAGASALGGVAQNQEMLFGARALQGVFAALLAPAALSLITVTFTDSKERAKAFGVYGGLSAGGAAIGLILGGLLTQYASWHWCLLVNVPIAILAFFLAIPNVHESKATGDTRYDIPGAITSSLGLVSLVYGITQVAELGWSDPTTLGWFGASLVLLASFFVIESRTSHPLLPMNILLNRNRGASYLTSFIVGAGLFGMFLFLAYFFQGILQYSPIKAGLLFLPFSVGVGISAGIASQALPRFGPRYVSFIGLLMATAGMLLLTRLEPASSYLSDILPALMVLSLGMGLVFVPISATALFGVGNHDAGVASAVLNTAQQIGGALGTALLNTVAVTATANYFTTNMIDKTDPANAGAVAFGLTEGFVAAFTWSAGFMILGAIIWVFMINADKNTLGANDVPVHAG